MTLPYDDAVLADTPFVYLLLEETSGTALADASGNAHPGTLSAPAAGYQSEPVLVGLGPSMTLAGQTITIPGGGAALGVHDEVSIEWLVTPTNLAPGIAASELFAFDGDPFARVNGPGILPGAMQFKGGSEAAFTTQKNLMPNGVPAHVVITYRYYTIGAVTGATTEIWINGIGSTGHSQSPAIQFDPGAGDITLATAGTPGAETHGRWSRFAVYPTALTSEQIEAHYAAITAEPPPAAPEPLPPMVDLIARINAGFERVAEEFNDFTGGGGGGMPPGGTEGQHVVIVDGEPTWVDPSIPPATTYLVPLTTVVAGEPQFIWTEDHQLVFVEESFA